MPVNKKTHVHECVCAFMHKHAACPSIYSMNANNMKSTQPFMLIRYDKGHIKSARISSANVCYANFMYVAIKIIHENKECQFMVFNITEYKASANYHTRHGLAYVHHFAWPVCNL